MGSKVNYQVIVGLGMYNIFCLIVFNFYLSHNYWPISKGDIYVDVWVYLRLNIQFIYLFI